MIIVHTCWSWEKLAWTIIDYSYQCQVKISHVLSQEVGIGLETNDKGVSPRSLISALVIRFRECIQKCNI